MAFKSKQKQGSKSFREFLRSRLGRYLSILLISAWMFVLGVLVGRQTVPIRFDLGGLNAELAELKAQEQQKQKARMKIDPQAADPKTELEFYEELKKSRQRPARSARPPAEPSKPAPAKERPKTVKPSAVKPDAKKVSKPAQTDAARTRKVPAASGAAESAPAADTESESVSLTVQAASLKNPEDADRLVSRLKKNGYPAYKTIAVVPQQGIWFRVRVGWFSSRQEADNTLQQLKKDGFDPFIVSSAE